MATVIIYFNLGASSTIDIGSYESISMCESKSQQMIMELVTNNPDIGIVSASSTCTRQIEV